MNDEQLKRQGFVKHDGRGVPNCYKPSDLVDVVTNSLEKPLLYARKAGSFGLSWSERCITTRITHHRPHISPEAQIEMAIEALEGVLAELRLYDNNPSINPWLAKADATPTTPDERNE